MDSRRDDIRIAGGLLRRLASELPRMKPRHRRKSGTFSNAPTDDAGGLTTTRLIEHGLSFTLVAEEPPSCEQVQMTAPSDIGLPFRRCSWSNGDARILSNRAVFIRSSSHSPALCRASSANRFVPAVKSFKTSIENAFHDW